MEPRVEEVTKGVLKLDGLAGKMGVENTAVSDVGQNRVLKSLEGTDKQLELDTEGKRETEEESKEMSDVVSAVGEENDFHRGI